MEAKGIAILEHPQLPYWEPNAASVWNLPEVRAVLGCGAGALSFDMCQFGADAMKPTTNQISHFLRRVRD